MSPFDLSLPVGICCDHAGFDYKEAIISFPDGKNVTWKDFGTYSSASVDYPDFAHPVASGVESNEFEKGVLLCGSGQGVCITANKHQGVRAALVWDLPLAPLARQHNDANVICFPVRFIELETALASLEAFLSTEFEGGRHQTRVDKISC